MVTPRFDMYIFFREMHILKVVVHLNQIYGKLVCSITLKVQWIPVYIKTLLFSVPA
jgi:hypothetical protein